MTISQSSLQRHAPYARYPTAQRGRMRSTRNKTLVLNKDLASGTDQMPTSESWITTRHRGNMTLMNAATYEAKLSEHLARTQHAIALKKRVKLRAKEAKEAEALKYLAQTTLQHLGATYRINKQANLLIRQVETNPTPLSTNINGVEFVKSPKTNNLYRKTSVKLNATKSGRKSLKRFCKHFTRSGTCPKGKNCPYQHSRDHLAICPHYLSKRGCARGTTCKLSHTSTANNAPTCTHFIQGACTVEHCKFSHIYTDPNADICLAFAKVGYCSQGTQCPLRHSRECVSKSAGECSDPRCSIHHRRVFKDAKSSKQSETVERDTVELEDDSSSALSTDDYEEEDFDATSFGDFVKL